MIPKKNSFFYKVIITLSVISLVYSTTFQQFKHFNINDQGFTDARSYISMSKNDYESVSGIHRYRFLIPKTVNILIDNKITTNIKNFVARDSVSEDKFRRLIFYIVNFVFIVATSLILFAFLETIGLNSTGSFVGLLIYITSRVTIYSTATPLVDSAQFFSVALMVYSISAKKLNVLSLLTPFLVLTKETVLPVIFLPFFKPYFRKKRYLLSISFAITSLIVSRKIINSSLLSSSNQDFSIIAAILNHVDSIWSTFISAFTINGVHDLIFSSYAFFLPLSVLGFFINRKKMLIKMPTFLYLLIPYSLFLSLLSGNLGRMFMFSFPIVIPFASLFLSQLLEQTSKINSTE